MATDNVAAAADKILRIAQEAGIEFDPRWGTCTTGNIQLAHFAYLIIHECAGLVEDHYDDGDDNSLAGYKIRKHFGLEK
jgi:hypothetical protein